MPSADREVRTPGSKNRGEDMCTRLSRGWQHCGRISEQVEGKSEGGSVTVKTGRKEESVYEGEQEDFMISRIKGLQDESQVSS